MSPPLQSGLGMGRTRVPQPNPDRQGGDPFFNRAVLPSLRVFSGLLNRLPFGKRLDHRFKTLPVQLVRRLRERLLRMFER